MAQLTLSFLLTDSEICLAYKKRGFGAGKWNGYGGKCEVGETVEAAAVREIHEESGVVVREADLLHVADHHFIYPECTHEVRVFLIRDWEGEPAETEEMRPAWYSYASIPYEEMWADDMHWLPRVLAGERLRGTVHFAADGESIARMEWSEMGIDTSTSERRFDFE